MPAAIPALIGAAASAAAASATVTGLVGGVLAVTVEVAAGIILAAGTILSAVAARVFAPSGPRSPAATFGDARQVIRQPVPPRQYVVGRDRIGGAVVLYDTSEDDPNTLVVATCHAAHEIDGVEAYWYGDEPATVDEDGYVTDPVKYAEKVPGSYGVPSVVRITGKPGSPGQAPSARLLAHFPTGWAEEHTLRGLAYSVTEATDLPPDVHYTVFQNGPQATRAVIRGAKVYDPRDPAQNPNDPATWVYSENWALCLLHFLTAADLGANGERYAHGQGLTLEDIDLDHAARAADVSDEEVAIKGGGSEPRWRVGGAWSGVDKRRDILADFLIAGQGAITTGPDGKLRIHAGGNAPATNVTISDADIIEYVEEVPDATERVNTVIATIISEDDAWQERSLPAFADDTAIDRAGREEPIEIPLRFVRHQRQGQRIAQAELRKAAPAFSGTLTTTLAGLAAWGERWVRLNLADLGFSGICEVASMGVDRATMTVRLRLRSYDDWWSWNAEADEKTLTTVPPRPGGASALPVPTGVTATVVSRGLTEDTMVALIKVSWAAVSERYTTEARWRLQSGTIYSTVRAASGQSEVEGGPLEDGETYVASVRHIGPGGTVSEWVDAAPVVATADPVAPSVVTNLSAADLGGGARLTWTAPSDSNTWRCRLYRHTANDFSGASEIPASPVYVNPGQAVTVDESIVTGTYFYWVTSENRSGVASAESAVASVTVS